MRKQSLQEKQEKLDRRGKTIYFCEVREDLKAMNSTIKEIINIALSKYDSYRLNRTQTTANKNNSQFLGSSRSLEDLYLICKHYKPEVSITEVVQVLKELPIYTFYCGSFQRQMFKFGATNTVAVKDYFTNKYNA